VDGAIAVRFALRTVSVSRVRRLPSDQHDFLIPEKAIPTESNRDPLHRFFESVSIADIGIDVRSPEPYERAASVFADYVDESPWA